MGLFWGIFLNLALVLFVINGLIWFRDKRQPQLNDREMFGAVSTSFGGADFWGAALVVLINVVGGQVASAWAGPATAGELTDGETPANVNVGLAWLIQGAMLAANWGVIAWRNRPLLDWRWSGVAALLIFASSLAVVLLVGILISL
jgi:uncharacterized membrane protein YhaH (DUF805 family)